VLTKGQVLTQVLGERQRQGRDRGSVQAGAKGRGRAEAVTKQKQKQRQTQAATWTEALEDRSGGRGQRPGMGCR